jgi:hypothetical protein
VAERILTCVDLQGVGVGVEVLISPSVAGNGDTLWVNVDGICRLRITQLGKDALVITDNRQIKEF